MSRFFANAAIATSLLLGASVATPAWGGKAHDAKCSMTKHKHVKRATAAAKAQPMRGVMLIDQRKADVQILSFGP